jgi:ribonuclease BN (tRNA processing enzyme)
VRVGGHTSCVLIWPGADGPPSLILDAGTGIRTVPSQLDGAPFRETILLTHLHWDHVQGLPFFTAGDRDDAVVRLLLPAQGEPAGALLDRAMSPPHFPIGTDGLRGQWTFATIDEGTRELEGCSVTARQIRHKGGRTSGYRIEGHDAVIAYLPDHQAPERGPDRDAAVELARDADLLIHDAQFIEGEEHVAELFGHSTLGQAVALATEAGAKELALFHHSPTRSDDSIDQIERTWSAAEGSLRVSVAVEGLDRRIDGGGF